MTAYRKQNRAAGKLWLIPAATLGILLLAIGIFAAQHVFLQRTPGERVVLAEALNVRQQPTAGEGSKVLGTLFLGETVYTGPQENGFYPVQAAHGLQGYASAAYLQRPSWYVKLRLKLQTPGNTVTFTNTEVRARITDLMIRYPDLARMEIIGQSTWGDDIYALVIGNADAPRSIMVQGGIHAREYPTGALCLAQAEHLLTLAAAGQSYGDKNIAQMLTQVNIWYIPLLNPDGAALAQKGLAAAPKGLRSQLTAMNSGLTDFSRWKANGRGVDLNANFDARWQIKEQTEPFGNGYAGSKPFSEPESRAIRDLAAQHEFCAMLCYHSAGEVIYWYFGQEGDAYARDLALAQQLAAQNGYRVVEPDTTFASVGGTKDWFVEKYALPGFTVELFEYAAFPVTTQHLQAAVDKNKDAVLLLLAHAAQN